MQPQTLLSESAPESSSLLTGGAPAHLNTPKKTGGDPVNPDGAAAPPTHKTSSKNDGVTDPIASAPPSHLAQQPFGVKETTGTDHSAVANPLSPPASSLSPSASHDGTLPIPGPLAGIGEAVSHTVSTAKDIITGHHHGHHNPGPVYTRWMARIHVKQYALNESFHVRVYLGDIPADGTGQAGSHTVFCNPATENCENCASRQEEVTEGYVSVRLSRL